jgi:hypothetical protein
MITGCNTNIRHRSKMFHVQTEDSGREHPHIISHVYHGGTIIASEKSEYRDRVDSEDLDTEVRGLIEQQHKTMLKRLRGGDFDAAIDERLNGAKVAAPPIRDTTYSSTTAGADTDPAIDVEEPAPTAPAAEKKAGPSFGESADSEKPLDEVILEYLVDKARERSREKKDQPGRQPRPKE